MYREIKKIVTLLTLGAFGESWSQSARDQPTKYIVLGLSMNLPVTGSGGCLLLSPYFVQKIEILAKYL